MAGNWQGMNLEPVRSAAQQLTAKGNEVESLTGKLDGEVHQLASSWHGKDSTDFASEWNGTHKAALKQIAKLLEDMGHKATMNANKQEAASQG
jgi:WXG100 family type VII secretion target